MLGLASIVFVFKKPLSFGKFDVWVVSQLCSMNVPLDFVRIIVAVRIVTG
jgi:hypothetical protein